MFQKYIDRAQLRDMLTAVAKHVATEDEFTRANAGTAHERKVTTSSIAVRNLLCEDSKGDVLTTVQEDGTSLVRTRQDVLMYMGNTFRDRQSEEIPVDTSGVNGRTIKFELKPVFTKGDDVVEYAKAVLTNVQAPVQVAGSGDVMAQFLRERHTQLNNGLKMTTKCYDFNEDKIRCNEAQGCRFDEATKVCKSEMNLAARHNSGDESGSEGGEGGREGGKAPQQPSTAELEDGRDVTPTVDSGVQEVLKEGDGQRVEPGT